MKSGNITFILAFFVSVCASSLLKAQEDSASFFSYKQHKETGLTIGYNFNFGEKADGKRPTPFHFVELGIWKSNIMTGHHPVNMTYYFATDIGLNTNDFVIAPKIGGFFAVMVLVIGGELVYYTDFHSNSPRLNPYMGLYLPYFKLTITPEIPILALDNKNFQNLNQRQLNLTIRIFKFRRTDK